MKPNISSISHDGLPPCKEHNTDKLLCRFNADDGGDDPNVDKCRPFPMQHKVMGWLEYMHTILEKNFFFTWQPVCTCSYI
jgi:hypothetical protein